MDVMTILEELGFAQLLIEDMRILLDNGKNLDHFFTEFFDENMYHFEMVEEYRKYKLENNQTSKQAFQLEYNKSPKQALESLFQHKVHNRDVNYLQGLLDKGSLTLSSLYDKRSENLQHRLALCLKS